MGCLDWTEVLNSEDLPGCRLNFVHDDVLAPGVSIGVHRHDGDEEYYYIVAGRGQMTLDNELFEVEAGDMACVFPGGCHGLKNNGTEDLRIVVFSVSP